MTNDRRNPFAGTTADLVENLIPTGRNKLKSRTYEKRKPGYTYYLRDAEIGHRISDIAYHYGMTVDSIAIEFIQAHGNARSSASSWTVQADGWPPEQIRERPRGKKRKTMTPEERNRKTAAADVFSGNG